MVFPPCKYLLFKEIFTRIDTLQSSESEPAEVLGSSCYPYLTCLGPTYIKGIALSIISRGGTHLAASAHHCASILPK